MLNFVYLPTKKQLIIVAKSGINQQTLRIFTWELFCSIQKYLQSFSSDLISVTLTRICMPTDSKNYFPIKSRVNILH